MVLSIISHGVNGNRPNENEFEYLKKQVNVIELPDGTIALAVADTSSSGVRPKDPNHQNYRRITIDLSVTDGAATQIDNITGKNGQSIQDIASGGYVISELFLMFSGVNEYNDVIVLTRGGTDTAHVVSEMNMNEGGITLNGGEKNNTLSTSSAYIKPIGFSGNISLVVGFYY